MIRLRGVFFLVSTCFLVSTSRSAEDRSTNMPIVLPQVTVTQTNKSTSLTSPSLKTAEEQKKQIPGGFTLRDATDMDRGRASNFQDLLHGIPGITLQSENGVEVTKYSSRGSGILSDDEPLGVIFLLDGFPFNQGDGEVILEDFSLSSIQYAEVFRGANAFKYGAITLGGAVNSTSKTGYDADPFQIRIEGGSYGFVRAQASAGGVEGASDYYASITGRTRDGYREHSYENTEDLFANFGYKISDNLENRFYLSVTRTDRLLPGGITKDEMNQDPKQVDPEVLAQDLDKQWYYLRLADKISYKNDVEEADLGGYWWHRNLSERGLFDDDNSDGIQGYYSDNFGIILNSVTHTELFGQKNNFTIGFTPTIETEVDADFQNNSGQEGNLTGKDAEYSLNAPLFAEDQQYVTEKLSVLAGIQAIYVQRHFSDYFNDTADGDQSHNLAFRTINPKVGAIYELNDKSQVYANFSRSWQPPSFDNMVDFDDNNPPDGLETPGNQPGSLLFTPLQPQHAWTVEVGTRGEKGRFGWELSLYHSWVRNELLEINNANGVDIGAQNITRSYHQGIEAGLEIDLLNSILVEKSKGRDGDRLHFDQTYTLNDFHFDGDPVYGDNRIAGIPIHMYEAELMYEAPNGFYAGPNLQWNITRYPVDHANTFNANDYALLGFKMGWQFKNGLSVFVEAKNLTDKTYASAVDPIPQAAADGSDEIFHPGDGRSFYGGMSFALK